MITVEKVAKTLGKSPQLIRFLLREGKLPFGVATKTPNSNNYIYVIFPEKFREYCGREGSDE